MFDILLIAGDPDPMGSSWLLTARFFNRQGRYRHSPGISASERSDSRTRSAGALRSPALIRDGQENESSQRG
jgi:hypothetical protein